MSATRSLPSNSDQAAPGRAPGAVGTEAGPVSGVALAEEPGLVEAALWRRLRGEASASARQALFALYRDLARLAARREHRRRPAYGLDRSDFEQLAYAGLLQAIDRFDPLRAVPFAAYARRWIKGAITDGLAVSSEDGARNASRQRAQSERVRSLRASARPADPVAALSDLAVGLAIGLILDGTGLVEPEDGACQRPDAYESLSWRELKRGLADEIGQLPASESIVIREHYQEGVPFTQIAELLGVSKGRVSQIHKAAIGRLQKRMRPFA